MSKQWKPGDVAWLVSAHDAYDGNEVGFCYEGGPTGVAKWSVASVPTGVWGSVAEARPLLVIDPEDREQVSRLYEALWAGNQSAYWPKDMIGFTAALRSLLPQPEPEPEPEEPTGLGAVVRDSKGTKHVRADVANDVLAHHYGEWHRVGGPVEIDPRSRWSDLARPLTVLSDGYTEDES